MSTRADIRSFRPVAPDHPETNQGSPHRLIDRWVATMIAHRERERHVSRCVISTTGS